MKAKVDRCVGGKFTQTGENGESLCIASPDFIVGELRACRHHLASIIEDLGFNDGRTVRSDPQGWNAFDSLVDA